MSDDGVPPGSAEKTLGEIVGEVSQKASLLVREEIELAKAEVTQKVTRIAKGAGFFAGAGVLLFFMVFALLLFLGFGIADWTGLKDWVGFAIVTAGMLVLAALLGLLGLRSIKRGTPPVPELAIEEAKKTRAALEEART
jgi:Putative Actinobacterial Holin-X, holin superfamily III